ncbi:hypothetical protein [Rhizobium sp. BK176]|uniref:hypothetical protein n=1 Tax=Rhizobium sp. BK176 TaxID=2587071 RepID=UPI002166DDD0|nr:hypothetical protein [Rhizobium sp. BK176]MCS4089431.1 hypothetical protein [Rhizobium sp. BK176]
MIDDREYNIDFRNEPTRFYIVDGRTVSASTDYKQSELGERLFKDLRGLITVERSLIGQTEDVVSRKIHNGVAKSLSYIARRVVTYWEQAAVRYEDPDSRELREIERKYYGLLITHFDEEAVAGIGKVGDLAIADFYKDVVKAPENEVNFQMRYTSRATAILGGFSKKHLPAIRERLEEIDSELQPVQPGNGSPAP